MFKKNSLTAIIATIVLLSGCGNTPKPSAGKEKPTVYIQSLSEEKFKDLTEETAIWRGISPHYIKNKQYLRCDMTLEMMALFANKGFELVNNIEKADYKLDVEISSCGSDEGYSRNNSDIDITEKKIYKDFSELIQDEKENLPKDAEEILALISKNNMEGFKKFYDGQYIQRLDSFLDNWKSFDKWDEKYLSKTKGIVFPNKYYKMSNEDKEAISHFYQTSNVDSKSIQVNHHISGINMLGGGANMVGTYGSGSIGGNMGAAFMGVGLLMAFDAVHPPLGINKFTLKNTKTGKKTIFYGEMKEHSWHNNLSDLRGLVFNNIPWGELD